MLLSPVVVLVQEEVPDACRLDPGDVGAGAGEHAGLVLHGAADGAEAHHAVHLPAVAPQLAEQRTARVALEEEEEGGHEFKFSPRPSTFVPVAIEPSYLAGSRWILGVPEAGTDHGVSDPVAPELLLSTGLEVDDGEASLIQGFCQRHVLLPA